MITTDKVYENNEWLYAYREVDPLGGIDPYSASKACAEIVISSYFRSFFFPDLFKMKHPRIAVTSVRAGNVIGGGDWAKDRIVPDCIRSIEMGKKIPVRNKISTRPWQHVLEPLGGYLCLGSFIHEAMNTNSTTNNDRLKTLCSPFNFGPLLSSNRTVLELVQTITENWFEKDSEDFWEDKSDPDAPHEAGKLNLAIDKAHHLLHWSPQWDFNRTVIETVRWYKTAITSNYCSDRIREITRSQIESYSTNT
jgi:CDP-glucose 4,6-dehydratase